MPRSVCDECFGRSEYAVRYQLHQLRVQVRYVHDAMQALKEDMTELYNSYKEL